MLGSFGWPAGAVVGTGWVTLSALCWGYRVRLAGTKWTQAGESWNTPHNMWPCGTTGAKLGMGWGSWGAAYKVQPILF